MVQTRSRTKNTSISESPTSPIQNGSTPRKRIKGGRDSEMMIFWLLLLDLTAFTMILPLLPSILEYYKNNENRDEWFEYFSNLVEKFREYVGAPDTFNLVLFGGYLGSLFSFLQFLTSPFWGALSDVCGRKLAFSLCAIAVCSSYALWMYSVNFTLFLCSRIIGGLGRGSLSLSMAAMTDVSTSENRARGMALIGMAFSIGFIVGPVTGALISSYSAPYVGKYGQYLLLPGGVCLAFAIINLCIVALALKETLPEGKRVKLGFGGIRQAFMYVNFLGLLAFNPIKGKGISQKDLWEIRFLGAVYFFHLFVYSGLEFTLTFVNHYTYGFTSMQQGLMFLGMGVIMSLIQGCYIRKISASSVQTHTLLGLFLTVPAFICVGLASNVYVHYIGVAIFSISTAFTVPCMTTIASKYGLVSQKGIVLGVFRSLGAFARSIGPILASIAFWSVGPTATYCAGGLLLAIPFLSLKFGPKMKV